MFQNQGLIKKKYIYLSLFATTLVTVILLTTYGNDKNFTEKLEGVWNIYFIYIKQNNKCVLIEKPLYMDNIIEFGSHNYEFNATLPSSIDASIKNEVCYRISKDRKNEYYLRFYSNDSIFNYRDSFSIKFYHVDTMYFNGENIGEQYLMELQNSKYKIICSKSLLTRPKEW